MNKIISVLFMVALISLPLSNVLAQVESSVTEIPIGSSALYIEIIDDKVYVTNPAEGKISVIDVNSREIVDTINAPVGILVIESAPDKNKLYATAEDQNKVFVFDLTTHSIIKEIDIGEPEITLFSKADKPYGQREYITFQTNGIGLAYNPNNEMLYVAHSEVNHINVIDTNTDETVATIPVGKTPLLIKIDNESQVGYVTNWESNDVTVINLDTNEVTASLATGFVPDQMTFDSLNKRLYVTHHASPHVTVIDLRDSSIEEKITLKGPTHAVALDSTTGILHVTYTPTSAFTGQAFLNRVEFIDTSNNDLIGGFEIPANPFIIRINDDQQLFATIIKDGIVAAVDLTTMPEYKQIIEKRDTSIAEDSSAGGGCLIATAAYGSEMAPQVQFLREIRDNTLLSTSSGMTFMTGFNSIYYSFSPTIADLERNSPIFKEAIKIFITPMISTLSIMTLADSGSEFEVLGLGISIIALNLGMYVAAPTVMAFAVKKRLK